MSEETTTPAADDGGPVKRDMKAIKAAAASKKTEGKPAGKAAAKARTKAAPEPAAAADALEDEVPLELIGKAIPQNAAPKGTVWLAYLGHQEKHLCYKDPAPILFQAQSWSNGWPVAPVRPAFAQHLVDYACIKTYSDGSRRREEDYEDMYILFDDLKGRRKPAQGSRRRKAGAA